MQISCLEKCMCVRGKDWKQNVSQDTKMIDCISKYCWNQHRRFQKNMLIHFHLCHNAVLVSVKQKWFSSPSVRWNRSALLHSICVRRWSLVFAWKYFSLNFLSFPVQIITHTEVWTNSLRDCEQTDQPHQYKHLYRIEIIIQHAHISRDDMCSINPLIYCVLNSNLCVCAVLWEGLSVWRRNVLCYQSVDPQPAYVYTHGTGGRRLPPAEPQSETMSSGSPSREWNVTNTWCVMTDVHQTLSANMLQIIS